MLMRYSCIFFSCRDWNHAIKTNLIRDLTSISHTNEWSHIFGIYNGNSKTQPFSVNVKVFGWTSIVAISSIKPLWEARSLKSLGTYFSNQISFGLIILLYTRLVTKWEYFSIEETIWHTMKVQRQLFALVVPFLQSFPFFQLLEIKFSAACTDSNSQFSLDVKGILTVDERNWLLWGEWHDHQHFVNEDILTVIHACAP